MKKIWRWNNKSSRRSSLDSTLDKVVHDLFLDRSRPKHRRTGAERPRPRRRRQSFELEAIEPRLLLSATATIDPHGVLAVVGDSTATTVVLNETSQAAGGVAITLSVDG